MTKQDVFRQISRKTGLGPLTSRLILESFFDVVQESLTKGEPIYIRTFGSFQVKRRAAKIGRNMGQNTAVKIEAHVVPVFRPGLDFMDQVRKQEMPISAKKAKS
ncbi:HU family DNA-binding protein [Spirosoma lituiforme]